MSTDTFIQVHTLRVARTQAWQPHLALQLMHALYALGPVLTLSIRTAAEGGTRRILWQIEAPRFLTDTITSALYSIYPHVDLNTRAKARADVGYFRYPILAAQPFYLPCLAVTDTGGVDVLAGVVSVMAQLHPDEALVYSLELHPPAKNYQQIGMQQIYKSGGSWLRWLTPGIVAQAAAFDGVARNARQTGRFAPGLQRLAEQKLTTPVKDVRFAVKIRAASQDHADAIFDLLQPALGRLDHAGVNALRPEIAGGRYTLALAPAEAALLWHLPSDQVQTLGVEWASQRDVPLPLEVIQVRDGLHVGTNTYQGRTHRVRLSAADRVTHVNLIGRTRVGKSTLLHRMVHQDIAAGRAVGVIDPHGDLVEEILAASIPRKRAHDVVLFDLNEEEQVIGLNLLAPTPGVPLETNASMALSVLRKFFGEQWNEGRMEDTFYAALVALMSMPGAVLQDVTRLFADSGYRRQVLARVEDPVALDYWTLEYERVSEGQRLVLAQPIAHRMRRLYRDRRMRRIIGASTCLDFRQVLDGNKILLVNLRGSPSLEGDTLGALLIAKLQMAAMGRSQRDPQARTPFYLYVDEVQNFITTSLATLLSESAKYGLYLTIANQFLSQLEGRTLKAVLGNVGTNIVFRCGADDAGILAPLLGAPFASATLTDLDRFRAVVKTQYEGRTLPAFLIDTEPPPPSHEDAAAMTERVRHMSRMQYGTPVESIDAELAARYATNHADGGPDLPPNPDEIDYFG